MCGITGFYSKRWHKDDLVRMTDIIYHRGPDAGGYFTDSFTGIALGHRRLSILDLSASANQPYYPQDDRYVAVFNGEVYNFQQLTAAHGINPRTSSDTEIVVELFTRHGVAAANEWNGMFALAIWDKKLEMLTLVRDRMGKKPIYYYYDGNDFAFSSELKSLKQLLPLKPDTRAAATFLHLGYLPGEQTFYQHVKRVLPGHALEIDTKGLRSFSYWTPQSVIRPEYSEFRDFADARDQLNVLLTESVSLRMISDVPLGTFLSGGTDSSVVTSIAQSLSDKPVKTFSIGFREAKYNESDHARKVARHLGTDHHEFILSTQDAMEQVARIPGIYDEPFADSSAIPTLLVSEMARKHVTVALSGDGGDELFLGYGMYNWAKRLSNPMIRLFHNQIALALRLSGKSRLQRAGEVFRYDSYGHIKSHIFSQEQYLFSRREIDHILTPGISREILIEENPGPLSRELTPEEAQSLFDMRYYLPDDLLVKVDRASMQKSLEVRCPLLDYRIVAFALQLPQAWKIQGGVQKHILKEVLYQYAPRELFDRPKWGFSIPLGDWLRGELRYLIDQELSEASLESVGIVNVQETKRLIKRFFDGEHYLYNRLWALILLVKGLRSD